MARTDGKGREAPPLIEYPLDYTFKVMGLAADDFPEHARGLVAAVVGDGPVLGITVRASAGGKYQSVSVSVRLTSEDERRRIYALLHADARVVYYL